MFSTYDEALDWLFKQTRGGAPRSKVRMQALVESLDLNFPKTNLYVVGTNGKGSVARMLANGLTHEGYKTGCFSSPHVSDFRERITIQGAMISQESVLAFLNQIANLPIDPHPAFFELTFALALSAFAEAQLECAVIEAGVGAKHDASNVLKNIVATVITNVSLDHQNSLGPAVTDIAADKAEAIRPNTPVFTAARGEALAVILAKAAELSSPVTVIEPCPDHLEENRQLVKACLEYLKLSPESIDVALVHPKLPGRLEHFTYQGRTIIIDGGHNPAAIAALCQSVKDPFIAVFSAKHSKDARANLNLLSQNASAIYLTSVLGERPNIEGYPYFDNPREALALALGDSSQQTIVVSGSFYLAGDLRHHVLELISAASSVAA